MRDDDGAGCMNGSGTYRQKAQATGDSEARTIAAAMGETTDRGQNQDPKAGRRELPAAESEPAASARCQALCHYHASARSA